MAATTATTTIAAATTAPTIAAATVAVTTISAMTFAAAATTITAAAAAADELLLQIAGRRGRGGAQGYRRACAHRSGVLPRVSVTISQFFVRSHSLSLSLSFIFTRFCSRSPLLALTYSPSLALTPSSPNAYFLPPSLPPPIHPTLKSPSHPTLPLSLALLPSPFCPPSPHSLSACALTMMIPICRHAPWFLLIEVAVVTEMEARDSPSLTLVIMQVARAGFRHLLALGG